MSTITKNFEHLKQLEGALQSTQNYLCKTLWKCTSATLRLDFYENACKVITIFIHLKI